MNGERLYEPELEQNILEKLANNWQHRVAVNKPKLDFNVACKIAFVKV